MFPVRLIYASTLTNRCDPEEVEEILAVARARNTAHDITGLLCFTADYFLQCLEGQRGVVNELYGKILVDPRHERVELLNYEETSARMFSGWSMAYMSPQHVDSELLLRHSGTSVFNPYRLDSNTAYSLLLDLGKQLSKSDLL
jgi:hypothetical protein